MYKRKPNFKEFKPVKTIKQLISYFEKDLYAVNVTDKTSGCHSYENIADQCGMVLISSLRYGASIVDQVCTLLAHFYPNGVNKQVEYDDRELAAVIFTDTESSTAWLETKKIAKRSLFAINPNTGNKVALWTIVHTDIVKIWNSQFKK